MKPNIFVLVAALAATLGNACAQSYQINWSTFDAGSGTSSGGGFTLNGTAGQPSADGPISGGMFSVSGGFWFPDPSGPLPHLAIRLGGANTVILSWPSPSTGYVLQQTANMSAPDGGWVDVTQTPVTNGSNKEVTLPATGAFCLFRLKGP
jgi:hypothetical protein